jgi:hypothetical protein
MDLNDLESVDSTVDAALLQHVELFVVACVQVLGPTSGPTRGMPACSGG